MHAGDLDLSDDELHRRMGRLERLARGLTSAELSSIGEAVAEKSSPSGWLPSERFWFSGVAGLDLVDSENRAMRELWTRLLVGLTFAITGVDLDARGADAAATNAAPSTSEDVGRRQELEGQATSLLERRLGSDVWVATVGVWNAFCAALLSERLDRMVREGLEASWVTAVGLTPRERIIAEGSQGSR
jgi:hypothetical protein